jgi:DNA-binding MarR family transcriptional regulator
VTPPSISTIVAKLEAEGLVRRSPDPADGRVTHASVTAAGRQLVEEGRRRKTTWLTGRVGALPAEQQARLADALDVLDDLTMLGDPA